MENDQSYFAKRAAQERSGAHTAGHGKAREAHEELADRYQDLVRTSEPNEQQPV
jgi:hypothetical protein